MRKFEKWQAIRMPGVGCWYQLTEQITDQEMEMAISSEASFLTLFQLNFPELHCWLLLNLDERDWAVWEPGKKHLSNSRIALCLRKDASQQFNEAWKDCIVEKA